MDEAMAVELATIRLRNVGQNGRASSRASKGRRRKQNRDKSRRRETLSVEHGWG